MPPRCPWCLGTPLMTAYHDAEWGVPLHDDRGHFEFLLLDAFQAGLSWAIVLNKREAFRHAFGGFDAARVARFGEARILRLLKDPGIVRNQQKIRSTVSNARAFVRLQERYGSFDAYVWQFVDGVPKQNRWRRLRQIPATTPASDAMSRSLRAEGFRFVGPTICYAYMQAAGMVNDHLVSCFRHREVARGG